MKNLLLLLPTARSAGWLALLLTFSVLPARAQPQPSDGEAFFHEGAQAYIGGQFREARQTVQEGLAKHPDDPKLLALKKKLKQRRKSRKQKQQKKKKGKGKKRKQKKKKQSGKQKNDQQKQKQKQQSQSGKKQKQKPPQQQKSKSQPQKPSSAKKQRLPKHPRKMSQQQALRILQALQHQEQKLLREVQPHEGARRHVEKDW